VAAPDHHEVLLENERVRVLDSRIRPGEQVPVHTHRWASVLYIMGTSDFIRYDQEGQIVFDSRTAESPLKSGEVTWSPPLSAHSVRNIGETEIRVIGVELKDQAPVAGDKEEHAQATSFQLSDD
jgi:mannose-6-phosphate isomerase-like protein (cupin superfamily)